MKVKLNLDKETIKTFLLEHVEKIVFGVVVLGFLLIVYNAVGRDTFDRTPEELQSAVANAEQHIAQYSGDPEADEVATVYGATVAHLRDNPIQVGPYKTTTRWDPPIFDPLGPRGDPRLFIVEELRGSTGSGRFAMKAGGERAGANAKFRGQRWVVLTGLVDYARQVKEYQRCFQSAQFQPGVPKEPTYLGFLIERATVDGSEAVGDLQWTKKDSFVGKAPAGRKTTRQIYLDQWANPPKDVVDEKFLDDSLTFPLGPLDGRNWGADVAHLEEIPLKNAAQKAIPEEPPEEPAGDDDDGPIFFGDQPAATRAATTRPEPADPDAPVDYRLLRFFDFDVEPGKQYRYRVRLVVKNPNYGVEDRFLVNSESSERAFLMSDFSAPTEPISVPYDSRVYVASVTQPRRGPSGTVRIQKFVLETGETVNETFKVSLGTVMNFEADGGARYTTDAVALDLWGGEPLFGRSGPTAPGEMLVLDRTGKLVWHNEFEDTKAFQASVASETESENDGASQPGFNPDATGPAFEEIFD